MGVAATSPELSEWTLTTLRRREVGGGGGGGGQQSLPRSRAITSAYNLWS